MSLSMPFQTENSKTTLCFPTRCSCCGERPGDEKWPVSLEVNTTYAGRSVRKSYSTEVPVCSKCQAEIQASSKRADKLFIWTILPSWILAGIILEFVFPPKDSSSLVATFLCFGGIAGLILGAIIGSVLELSLKRLRPLADNGFVQFDQSGKLKFKNKQYQAEFDSLNMVQNLLPGQGVSSYGEIAPKPVPGICFECHKPLKAMTGGAYTGTGLMATMEQVPYPCKSCGTHFCVHCMAKIKKEHGNICPYCKQDIGW